MFEMLKDTHSSEDVAHQFLSDHLDRILETALKSPEANSLDKPLQLMTAYFIFCESAFFFPNR
jgi:hypothetical protein